MVYHLYIEEETYTYFRRGTEYMREIGRNNWPSPEVDTYRHESCVGVCQIYMMGWLRRAGGRLSKSKHDFSQHFGTYCAHVLPRPENNRSADIIRM